MIRLIFSTLFIMLFSLNSIKAQGLVGEKLEKAVEVKIKQLESKTTENIWVYQEELESLGIRAADYIIPRIKKT